MTSDDARNLAIILGTFVAALSLVKAVIEYTRQNAQTRAEHYFKLREKFKESERFNDLFELIRKDDPHLADIPYDTKRDFLGFYEDIALLINAGLLKKAVAHYMFGFYAIRCSRSENFWTSMDQESPYWLLFKHFVVQMEQAEKTLYANPESVASYRL